MKTADLNRYADLVLHSVALQPDQSLLIKGEPSHWEFINVLAARAYERGARYVHVRVDHAGLYRARVEHSRPEYLGQLPAWHDQENVTLIEEGWALISIKSPDDPDALAGIDTTRHGIVQKALSTANYEFRLATQSKKVRWIVVAYPSERWAAKVLDRTADEDAADALWAAMKPILRLDQEDPKAAWSRQVARLQERQELLNSMALSSLKFTGPGTDLTVGLSESSRWVGGGSVAQDGVAFMPNLPTEEVFTAPDFRRTEGRVTVTRPVQILGSIVTGAWLEFAEGRVTDFGASDGAEILERYFSLDDRARYLGELALVDSESPVYQSGLVFYNTLFDENAACHIALGSSYPSCIAGSEQMTEEEYREAGGNRSTLHTDVMISSPEVDVTGQGWSGNTVQILRAGSFVM